MDFKSVKKNPFYTLFIFYIKLLIDKWISCTFHVWFLICKKGTDVQTKNYSILVLLSIRTIFLPLFGLNRIRLMNCFGAQLLWAAFIFSLRTEGSPGECLTHWYIFSLCVSKAFIVTYHWWRNICMKFNTGWRQCMTYCSIYIDFISKPCKTLVCFNTSCR